MNTQPLVSVIVITRNRPQYLKECLRHFKKQGYSNFEIIVVDSSLNQESRKVVDEYPDIKYIRFYNGKNMAISRNLGITDSKGEIVSFVDDDCLIEEDWLKEMVRSFTDEKIGEVGGRIIDENRLLYTQEASKIGRIYPNGILSGFHDYDGEKPFFVDYLAGNMSFRKDVLTELGGFDPIFRVWNDVDICMRVKKAGYSIVFNPRIKLYHKLAKREFISRDRSNFISQYIYNRSHSCCLFKNKGFKYAYFKTLFYWRYIDTLKNNHHSSLVKKMPLIFGQLSGSITGLILAIKVKICGEGDYFRFSERAKKLSEKNYSKEVGRKKVSLFRKAGQLSSQKEGEKEYRAKLVRQQVLGEKVIFEDHPRNLDELLDNWIYPQISDLEKILKKTGIKNESKILEIGSENSHLSLYLKKAGYFVVGIDLSLDTLRLAVPKISEALGCSKTPFLINADAEKLPFKENSFDVVYCFSTLHHFPELSMLANEICRVMKKEGIFFFAWEPLKSIFGVRESIDLIDRIGQKDIIPSEELYGIHEGKYSFFEYLRIFKKYFRIQHWSFSKGVNTKNLFWKYYTAFFNTSLGIEMICKKK